jgi:hypothetical protein
MKQFTDEAGKQWVAAAFKEDTPRHHGIWFMAFHAADDPSRSYPLPEIRWQTSATAARTLKTMSEFELRRRLQSALQRNAAA